MLLGHRLKDNHKNWAQNTRGSRWAIHTKVYSYWRAHSTYETYAKMDNIKSHIEEGGEEFMDW